jgi:N-acetylglucosaminyldiphosphoundecaprenol N-acetyl-beta-D-mannosaminyltransferase
MIDRGKHNLLGVGVDAVDYAAAVSKIVDAARERRPLAVSALAVHGLMTGVLDAAHRYRLNKFDLICPDGQPVRWGLNLLHRAKLPDRVYGPDLMLRVCEAAAKEGLPIFLFGGGPALLERLSQRLLEQFPDLKIAGARPSKFRKLTPGEWDELVEEVRSSGARVMFVGLGCPRQEVFAYEAREAVSIPTLAVGAAFNFHSGLLPQAPRLMQRYGLEWFYRLLKEPRRLWRRYVFLNPAYLTLIALQMFNIHHVESEQLEPPEGQAFYG